MHYLKLLTCLLSSSNTQHIHTSIWTHNWNLSQWGSGSSCFPLTSPGPRTASGTSSSVNRYLVHEEGQQKWKGTTEYLGSLTKASFLKLSIPYCPVSPEPLALFIYSLTYLLIFKQLTIMSQFWKLEVGDQQVSTVGFWWGHSLRTINFLLCLHMAKEARELSGVS